MRSPLAREDYLCYTLFTMSEYTLQKRFVVFLILLVVALSAMGIASVVNDRSAEATSYSQTDFAVTGYESFMDVLAYKNNDFSGKTIRLFRDIDITCLPEEADVYF